MLKAFYITLANPLTNHFIFIAATKLEPLPRKEPNKDFLIFLIIGVFEQLMVIYISLKREFNMDLNYTLFIIK